MAATGDARAICKAEEQNVPILTAEINWRLAHNGRGVKRDSLYGDRQDSQFAKLRNRLHV